MIIGNTISIANFIVGSSAIDTNPSGQQAFLLIGDSIAQGSNNTTGPGPTPTSGTSYYWNYNTSTVTEITNSDILGASNGSIAPQFCINYNASTGNKAVIIPAGVSGSRFYAAAGGTSSWFTNGANYTNAQSRATACMNALGVNTLKGIIMILGVNDINSSDDLTTLVAPAIDSLFTRLTTDYPGVPIYVVMPGRTSSTENMNNRFAIVRSKIRTNMETYANVHLACYLSPFVARGLYGADNLHPTQTGNNTIGATINTYIQNSSYQKWTRSVLALFETDYTSDKKTAINTFITNQVANGNWAKLDTFQVWTGPTQNDVLTDWRYFTCTKLSSATFTANDNLSSDGVSTYIRPEFIPSLQGIKGTANNFFVGLFIRDNLTGSGTQANALGGINSTQRIQLFQNSSGATAYQANDSGGQVIAGQIILDDTWYTLARTDASTKRLLKNGVQAISVTQAVSSALAREIYVGATNSTGTAASYINCSYRAFAFGQESNFDHASFYSDLNTLLTALSA